MKTMIRAVLISAALGIAVPAVAQVGISLNFGDVAIGYRDGYWDSHHRWHRWAHADDWRQYQRAHPEHYHDYTHDHDHDDHHH